MWAAASGCTPSGWRKPSGARVTWPASSRRRSASRLPEPWWAANSSPGASSFARVTARAFRCLTGASTGCGAGTCSTTSWRPSLPCGNFGGWFAPEGRSSSRSPRCSPPCSCPRTPSSSAESSSPRSVAPSTRGGGRSFQERRQTTLASLRAVGLTEVAVRNYLLQRRAPLGAADHDYIQNTVFTRNWGARLRELLTPTDWDARSALCEPDSPKNILRRPDYFCLYPITVFHCGSLTATSG